jgi:L-aspartate oxidase
MRQYVYPIDLSAIENKDFDVIVVGEGLAGLYTALNISPKLKVAILSKSINETSSYLSQGGVAAVINPDDNIENHFKDTLVAGAGLCDEEAVRLLVTEGPQEIKKLVEWDVPFDKKSDGTLQTTLEGGHSMRRILHCGGDRTGREIVEHLMQLVQNTPNIEEIHHSYLIDIITEDNKTSGVLIYKHSKPIYLKSNYIVLCTGGIGALYPSSTNPTISTGDGIGAAMRAGAHTNNMEFIQFHPTSFYDPEDDGKAFLISEAVRGEGGILRNEHGEAFMEGRHPLSNLAPRDIVAREITKEIKKSTLPYVYLDITHKSREFLEKRFPTIFAHCLSHGVDISKDFIKVCPVQHYFMGGIVTDLKAKTNIEGLYACGETACTGVHGANRLASNSLLECLVFSKKAAIDINENFNNHQAKPNLYTLNAPSMIANCPDFSDLMMTIKNIMLNCAGIVRNEKDMTEGIELLSSILKDLSTFCVADQQYLKVLNMATVGLNILTAANARRENAGAHFRDDL